MTGPFLAVLTAGADLGLIAYDEAVVSEPHGDVAAFDLGALMRDEARIRELSVELVAVRGATDFDDAWRGVGADAAAAALAEVGGRIEAARLRIDDLSVDLGELTVALSRVLTRYRETMRTVGDPVLLGVELDLLPAALAAGAVQRDAVRAELINRIEYAHASAIAASRAITAAVGAFAAVSTSSGELALAGGR